MRSYSYAFFFNLMEKILFRARLVITLTERESTRRTRLTLKIQMIVVRVSKIDRCY